MSQITHVTRRHFSKVFDTPTEISHIDSRSATQFFLRNLDEFCNEAVNVLATGLSNDVGN